MKEPCSPQRTMTIGESDFCEEAWSVKKEAYDSIATLSKLELCFESRLNSFASSMWFGENTSTSLQASRNMDRISGTHEDGSGSQTMKGRVGVAWCLRSARRWGTCVSISSGVARKWKDLAARKDVFTKSCGVGLRGGVV